MRQVLSAICLACIALPAAAATVDVFTPQGTVKSVRQVTARFSRAIVRFGDPRAAEPFDIECAAPGRSRWADGRNWVYDFEADVPAGIVCRFTLKTDLKTLDGETVKAGRVFSFDTGGPAIRASAPSEGDSAVDENQVFLLALDAPAAPESVTALAHCVVDGIAEKIPVKLVTGKERQDVLAQRRLLGYRYYRLLWKDGRPGVAQVADDALQKAEEQLTTLRCGRPLPPDTRVQLVWDKGIATASGVTTRKAQILPFQTRPAFLARFSCSRANPQAACLPMLPMRLDFTAPVSAELAAQVTLEGGGRSFKPKPETGAQREWITFPPPFPESTSFRISVPAALVDDAGRRLENAERFPLEVATDAAPPLAKFAGEFGILELHQGGVLPVTLRNLESEVAARKLPGDAGGLPAQRKRVADDGEIAQWIENVKTAMAPRGEWVDGHWIEATGDKSVFDADQGTPFTVPKPGGAREFEVVGIPLVEPGFYVVELQSPKLGAALLGDQRTRYVATAALVTNLAVHFKWGREASLAFVTRLDDGAPVAGAAVRISDYCNAAPLWQGTTGDDGIARVTGKLPQPSTWGDCESPQQHPLMVSARKDGDLSFTVTTWARGIGPGDFNLPIAVWEKPLLAHTVTDRALFRAGETVSMKHFWRRHTSAGFALPDAKPTKLVIAHRGSDQRIEQPLDFDAAGIAESRWPIPKDARLGEYDLALLGADGELQSGSLRVEQYRVPTMHAVVQPRGEPLVDPRAAEVDLFVSYLAGGGAAGAPVKLRSQVRPRGVSFPGYDDFHFGGEPVVAGIQAMPEHGFFPEGPGGEDTAGGAPAQVLPLTLDASGATRAAVPGLPAVVTPQELVIELEYADANGELLSSSRRVPLWPARVVPGIRLDGWVATEDELRFQLLALDLAGKRVTGQKVMARLYQRVTHSYRRRLVGGFYAYEHTTEIKPLDAQCSGRSDAQGLVACDVAPDASGEILIEATATDKDGKVARAVTSAWVAGDRDWWFAAGPSDRMDLVPEERSYEAGETARFQVRMPFRSATALVTVEREGVIDSFVTQLSGRKPVIELPIQDHYAPNVYVSVLALRGRIGWFRSWLADIARKLHLPWKFDGGAETARVDLSKPAYRVGMAGIRVGWKPHRLDVRVAADREAYEVRGQAQVTIDVKPATGSALPRGAEVAIAAVDEGLLELQPNRSWNLLEAMMGARGIEVFTSTAQMQVVGKRHYGRKAAPPGGGGGYGPARELLDTLLLWQGRVPLDANGRAALTIPLNDALTSFRITAVASAGLGLFGSGSTRIRTTQDLQMISGLPPLVRQGDRFRALFTVRNASDRALSPKVGATVTVGGSAQALPELAPQLAPGAAQELGWELTVPADAEQLAWEITAADGKATDRLKVTQQAIAVHPVRIYQATLAQVEPGLAPMPVQAPADALPGRGGVRVELRARLGEGLDAVREYMARYPYVCIEQRASQAVALRDAEAWGRVMALLPSHLDRDGLAKYFPSDWLEGSDALTAYLLALAHEAGWEIPEGERNRMLRALTAFADGRIMRGSPLQRSDQTIRKLAAIEALSRYGRGTPAALTSLELEPNLLPTSALLDWLNLLTRLPDLPDRDAKRDEAQQILRARLNFQGTTMSFSTERSDALWWLMISPDVNSVRTILSLLAEPSWREDLPRLVRGALGRQQQGHWNTTTANAWGVLAMEKFGAEFERETVSGATSGTLATHTETHRWQGKAPGMLDFAWPAEPASLALTHEGAGKPWAFVQSRAAIPLKAPLFTGYALQRTVVPVEQKAKGRWTRGDVARVRLEIDAQSDMTWVVIDDPVPAGASVLGGGLARDSAILSGGEKREGHGWLAYEERRFEAFRAYYAFVPKGKLVTEYTVRFNADGRFELPATRVEAMYAPEMFGELPNGALEVQP